MIQEIDAILSFLWAFVVTVFAIPSIVYVAHLKNLLDEPDHRRLHDSLTPRLGGLAIFAGFMSAITIFGDVTSSIQRTLASVLILFFIGLKDDVVSISAFKKFFVQILATGIVMFLGDIRIANFYGFLGLYELPEGISYGFTFLVITGITNAINLIDGLDGLAGIIITIIMGTFGFYFFMYGGPDFAPYAKLCFCLMGAVVGFLRYNIKNAIIFMGDTGSLVCGFLVAITAIKFIDMQGMGLDNTPSLAIGILVIPIFDTMRVFSLRILNGRSPFSPDKNHIHHVLKRAGLSQLAVVITLATINVGVIVLMNLCRPMGDTFLIGILAALFIGCTLLIEFYQPVNKQFEAQKLEHNQQLEMEAKA